MIRYKILFFIIICFITAGCKEKISNLINDDRQIEIFPDYDSVTIPFNIAPLNFYLKEIADKYQVEISSENGKPIKIQQTSPDFNIPLKEWHELLSNNKGKLLSIFVLLKNGREWHKCRPVIDSIASDPIHPYLVYRLISTQYTFSSKMKLAQRNLESFNEYLIWENSSTDEGCFNCHSFSNYNPDKMSLHLRQFYGGTLIKDGKKLTKLNTKTPYTMSAFGYVGSNPDGDLIAYSTNLFNEYFTNSTKNLNEVTDQASDILVYNIKTNTVTTSPQISTKNRENFPSWSADGKSLYYISAGEAGQDFYSRYYGMYSLCKISYDKSTNTWGKVDTIFSAYREGKSLTFPRESPDGKYLLFCLIDYGYFSINHRESDLYIMDLATRKYHKLDINSSVNDSYHSWSQNGRWIVFSSKRFNNLYSAPHFSYFDTNGKFHKPFILPQEDPHFYDTYLLNYNIPEFVNGRVDLDPIKVRDVIYKDGVNVKFDSTVDVDALSGATWIKSHK
jgi:hypothetical protein